MTYKLYLTGGGPILLARRLALETNPSGGIRTLRVYVCESIWTGHHHLGVYHVHPDTYVTVQLSDVAAILSRSSLDEDNEPWKELFVARPQVTTSFYEYWARSAEQIEKVLV